MMWRSVHRAALLALLGIVCSEDVRGREEVVVLSTQDDEDAQAKPLDEAKAPVLEVLSSGDEPRSRLRFRIAKGKTQPLIMTMKMGMEMSVGGTPLPNQKLPGQKMTAETTVTDVADDGDFTYDFVFSKAELVETDGVQPIVLEAMKSVVGEFVGVKGNAVVSDRGFVKDGGFRVEGPTNPQLKQILDSLQQTIRQVSFPLPEETIGVGAKWKASSRLDQNGLMVDQTATYTILEIEGTRVRLKFEIEQTAPPQAFNPPGLPPAAKIRLVSLKSIGSGELTMDTTAALPMKSTLELTSDSEMRVDVAGMEREMSMKMTMQLGLVGE